MDALSLRAVLGKGIRRRSVAAFAPVLAAAMTSEGRLWLKYQLHCPSADCDISDR
jgi:hypothetical protein